MLCLPVFAVDTLPDPQIDKTPSGLANWAINAYNQNFGYAKGYYCQVINADNLAMYSSLYPDYYTSDMQSALSDTISLGKRYADCIGLVKGYFWYNSDSIIPNYSIFPDTSAEDLFRNAKVKGNINNIPDIPGIIVYDANVPHIGIYVGNGMVIDDRTFESSMHYSTIESYTWTNYILLDQLDYDTYNTNTQEASRLFSRQLQSIETAFGFLPSDILAALIVIFIFIIALGLIRIVL